MQYDKYTTEIFIKRFYELNPEMLAKRDNTKKRAGRQGGLYPTRSTFVYVLENRISGLYKIGFSKDYKKRIKAIRSILYNNGVESDLDIVFLLDGNCRLESELHKRFRDVRRRGEWFALAVSDIESIETEFRDYIIYSRRSTERMGDLGCLPVDKKG